MSKMNFADVNDGDVYIDTVEPRDDPFRWFPRLQGLWTPDKQKLAEEYAKADAHTGDVFYIVVHPNVVGITGVFIDPDDEPHVIRLRWTGVNPEFRRQGVAKKAIKLVIDHVKSKYPERTILMENVPDTEHGEQNVAPFFQALGFVKCRGPYRGVGDDDWAGHGWQDYALNIGGLKCSTTL